MTHKEHFVQMASFHADCAKACGTAADGTTDSNQKTFFRSMQKAHATMGAHCVDCAKDGVELPGVATLEDRGGSANVGSNDGPRKAAGSPAAFADALDKVQAVMPASHESHLRLIDRNGKIVKTDGSGEDDPDVQLDNELRKLAPAR